METPFNISDAFECLSDIARTNSELWTEHSNLAIRPREMTAPSEATNLSQSNGLPLIPTPKSLQTQKRARDTEIVDTLMEHRVVVLNLPRDTAYEDLDRMFGPYKLYDIECINLGSQPTGYAVVEFASAEEARRAIRDLSGTLLRGSPISLFEEHATGLAFIDGVNFALSKMNTTSEGNRPAKRIRSGLIEEASNDKRHTEQSKRQSAKKKHNTRPSKHIEYLIGGLNPNTQAYQVKAFLDSHRIKCATWPQKTIRRSEDLGFYTSFTLLNNDKSKADIRRLSGQQFDGSEIKIQLVEESVTAVDRWTTRRLADQHLNESEGSAIDRRLWKPSIQVSDDGEPRSNMMTRLELADLNELASPNVVTDEADKMAKKPRSREISRETVSPDDEAKAQERKNLKEWWIRERGIYLDI